MKSFSKKWRRIGSFVIDISIISMLYQVIGSLIAFFIGVGFTNLFYDIAVYVLYLLLFIGVSVAYSGITYHYFKYPLGKLLMSVKVLAITGERITTKNYLKRELTKYSYLVATLFLYAIWNFFEVIVHDKQAYHEKISQTQIVY